MPLGGLLTAGAGLASTGLNLFGALGASGQQKWNDNAKVGVLNALNQLLGNATGNVDAYSGAIIPALTGFSMGQLSPGAAYQSNVQNALGQLQNNINNGQFTNPTSLTQVPGLDQVLNATAGQFNKASSTSDLLGSMLGGIGSNPALNTIFQTAGAMSQGGGGQQALSGAASGLLSGGNNAFSNALQQTAAGLLPNSGYNNALNYATQYGQGLTAPQGNVQQAQQVASNIIGQNPLLSMNQALSLATDQSATQAHNQFQALKQQLANQTGMTGPAIAGGGVNDFLSQAGDQALQAQAQAQSNALLNQQQLQSNLFGQGVNLFGQGVQGALGYSGQGLNSMLQAANQANANLGTAGNLGLASTAQQLQNLLGGGQLQGESNNATLQSLNSLLGGLGAQNSMVGTDINGMAQMTGLSNNDLNSWANNLFNVQNLGQTQQANSVNSILSALNQQGGLANAQVGQGLTAAQFPANQLNNWMSLLGNVYQNMTGLFGSTNTSPVNFMAPVASLLQQGNPLGNISTGPRGGSNINNIPMVNQGNTNPGIWNPTEVQPTA